MWSWQYPAAPMTLSDYLPEEDAAGRGIVRRGLIEQILFKVHPFEVAPRLDVAEHDALRPTRNTVPAAAHGLARFDSAPLMACPAPSRAPHPGL
jgi:hypothetical protein